MFLSLSWRLRIVNETAGSILSSRVLVGGFYLGGLEMVFLKLKWSVLSLCLPFPHRRTVVIVDPDIGFMTPQQSVSKGYGFHWFVSLSHSITLGKFLHLSHKFFQNRLVIPSSVSVRTEQSMWNRTVDCHPQVKPSSSESGIGLMGSQAAQSVRPGEAPLPNNAYGAQQIVSGSECSHHYYRHFFLQERWTCL